MLIYWGVTVNKNCILLQGFPEIHIMRIQFRLESAIDGQKWRNEGQVDDWYFYRIEKHNDLFSLAGLFLYLFSLFNCYTTQKSIHQ